MDLYDIKGVFNVILYGTAWLHLFELDTFLKFFSNVDYLSNEQVYSSENGLPPDYANIIRKLSEDRMINISQYGIEITLDGKMKIANGGYRRKILLKRIGVIGCVIGVVASAIAVISFFG